MKTKEFLSILETHKEKSLLFEYQPSNFVPASYHITEVKNIQIEAIDCGARSATWEETLIQLWESPAEKHKSIYMPASKALDILKRVDTMRPLTRDAELKFEYGNANFHTAQLFVNQYSWDTHQIIFKLGVEKTDCKAKASCGVPETSNATVESCVPGTGCC
ncbi:MAG: DUF6428 family protein [Bacteroidota bacterium]